jgi:2-isopropylmalate synthase
LSDAEAVGHKLDGLGLHSERETLDRLVALLRQRQAEGWQYDAADASFHLLALRHLQRLRPWFETQHYTVLSRGRATEATEDVEAAIQVKVGGELRHEISEGNGFVNALDRALRKALLPMHPSLREMKLIDYAARVTAGHEGSAGRVRVTIQSQDLHRGHPYTTMGVSENIVAATWAALVDAFEYKRLLDNSLAVA